MVLEDLLSEPADGGMMDICADVPDAGLELSRAASRASSTLERGLKGQEAGLDCPAPMEVGEGPSALEVAVTKSLALKDGASAYPAPEGVPSPRGCLSRFSLSHFHGRSRRVFSSAFWLHGSSPSFGSGSCLRGRRS